MSSGHWCSCHNYLPVAVNSITPPVLLSLNVFALHGLVTTIQRLEGTWSTEEILCFSTDVSFISPCIQLYNKTMGVFHSNITYGTMSGMELYIPLLIANLQRIP